MPDSSNPRGAKTIWPRGAKRLESQRWKAIVSSLAIPLGLDRACKQRFYYTTELLSCQHLIVGQPPTLASAKAALRRRTRRFRVIYSRISPSVDGSSSTSFETRCAHCTRHWRQRKPITIGSLSSCVSIATAYAQVANLLRWLCPQRVRPRGAIG